MMQLLCQDMVFCRWFHARPLPALAYLFSSSASLEPSVEEVARRAFLQDAGHYGHQPVGMGSPLQVDGVFGDMVMDRIQVESKCQVLSYLPGISGFSRPS